MAKKVKAKKPASVKGLGGGKFKNTKKGSSHFGQVFTKDTAGNHVYTKNGKSVVVGHKTTPFDPTAPISTQQDFDTRVNSAADVKYGPQEQALAAQGRVAGQQATNRASWWDEYQQRVGAAQQRQQAAYAQTQAGIYGQANQMRSQDDAQSSQLDAAAQQAAQLRGASATPSVAPQAAASRQAYQSGFGNLTGLQGANQSAYMADVGRIGAGQKVNSQLQGQQDQRKVAASQAALAGEKGAYKTQYGTDLRQQEFQNRLGEQTLGITQQKNQTDAAIKLSAQRQAAKDKAAQRKVTKRGQNVTLRGQDLQRASRDKTFQLNVKKYGDTKAKDMYQRTHGLGPYKQSSSKGGGGSGMSAPHYGSTGVTKAKAISNRVKWEDLINTPGKAPPKSADQYLVKVAKEYFNNGHKVTKPTAQKVYRLYGFRLPIGKPKPAKKFKNKTQKKLHGIGVLGQ